MFGRVLNTPLWRIANYFSKNIGLAILYLRYGFKEIGWKKMKVG